MELRRGYKYFIRSEGLSAANPDTSPLLQVKSLGWIVYFATIGPFAGLYLVSSADSFSEWTPTGGSAGEQQGRAQAAQCLLEDILGWDGKIIEVTRGDNSHGPISKADFGLDIAGTGKASG